MPFDSCKFDVYFDHSDPNYTGTGRFDYDNYIPPTFISSRINYAKESNVSARYISISNTSPFSISVTNKAAD